MGILIHKTIIKRSYKSSKWLLVPSCIPTSLAQRCTCFILGGNKQRAAAAAAAAGASTKQMPSSLKIVQLTLVSPGCPIDGVTNKSLPLGNYSRNVITRVSSITFKRRSPKSNKNDWTEQ